MTERVYGIVEVVIPEEDKERVRKVLPLRSSLPKVKGEYGENYQIVEWGFLPYLNRKEVKDITTKLMDIRVRRFGFSVA